MIDFAKHELEGLATTPSNPFNGASVDVNGLGWAFASTTSRAFRASGPSQPGAMLPLIDMCNHSFDPNCAISGDSQSGNMGALSVVAQKKINEGEP